MKQKLLATLLALCLVVGMLPVAASAAEGDVAQVEGGSSYASLAEAVEAVIQSDSKTGTVKLLKNAAGSGIGLFNGKGATGVNLTIDFGGNTYTCQDPAVGSTGTESQGFHLEKGNTVTLKNGTIDVDGNSTKTIMLIQNYCDLTLEDLDLHGSAVTQYMISSNYGNTTLRNVNITGTHSSLTGIDLMHWLGDDYGDKAPTMEIQNTSANTIEGAVDVYCYGTGADTCSQKPSLKISGGAFSADVSQYAADGYTVVQNGEKYVVQALTAENAVAQVGSQFYDTLDKAFSAAQDGATIRLLRSATHNARINVKNNTTLDLGGFTLTSDTANLFVVYEGKKFTMQNGTIRNESGRVAFAVKNAEVTLSKDAVLECKYGVTGTNSTAEEGGATFNIYGKIHSSDIAVWGQGPKNTFNIDGAELTANNFAVYQNGSYGGNTYTIKNSTISNGNEAGPAIYISNSKANAENQDQGYQMLTVENSTISGSTGIEVKFTNATVNNCTITATAAEPTYDLNNNGSTTCGFAVVATDNTMKPDSPAPGGKITVNGGNYSGLVGLSSLVDQSVYPDFKETEYEITAGYFTSDPSGYLAEGKAAVESDKAGYNYMVAEATTTPAEVVPAAPEANVNPALTGEDQKAAEAIQNALTPETVTGDGVSAAANSVANQNTVTANDEVLAKLNAAIGQGGTQATDQNTTIVVQPYMDIAIEDVDTQAQTVTLEITPMYRTVATTADVEHNGDIVLEADPTGGATVNAVQIGEEKPLTITKPVTMTLTLPDGFKDKTVYIQHKGYEYSAAADSDGKITFTNPHGFSSFTFDTTSHAVAKIEGTTYTSLQDAVNHVQDGQTITLLKDGQSATVDREVSFIIGNEGGNAYKAVLAPGSGYTMTEGENGQYTFTKKVTPGPGGEEEDGFPFTDVKTSDWYYDAVKYVYENGLMAGTSETTFAPEVKLNRAMAVQILYNLEGKPAVTEAATFTDAAAAGEWALDAIAWAQQTGVVAGMGDNLFAPAAQVTREQFAQMMYNYAEYKGYDLTAAGDLAQFTDSGKLQPWAVTAMKWANGNGLINGFEDNTLQPAGTTIRGQAASIIMNFDKNVAK